VEVENNVWNHQFRFPVLTTRSMSSVRCSSCSLVGKALSAKRREEKGEVGCRSGDGEWREGEMWSVKSGGVWTGQGRRS
jgi:hypothetical protein